MKANLPGRFLIMLITGLEKLYQRYPNKYLVDQHSGKVWHFPGQVRPDDHILTGKIESLL